MTNLFRAALARLIRSVAFVVVVVFGVAAGWTLSVAEEVTSEIKKKAGSSRPVDRR